MTESTSSRGWGELRTMIGPANFVPGAITRMMSSTTPEEASIAYWELDNRVVVQGQLFQAAERVTREIMTRICVADYSTSGLARALDLLVELAYGEPDQSEIELGEDDLGARCRSEIVRGLDCIKALASSTDERVLLGLLDLVDRLDTQEPGRTAFFSTLPRVNWPEAATRRLREIS